MELLGRSQSDCGASVEILDIDKGLRRHCADLGAPNFEGVAGHTLIDVAHKNGYVKFPPRSLCADRDSVVLEDGFCSLYVARATNLIICF